MSDVSTIPEGNLLPAALNPDIGGGREERFQDEVQVPFLSLLQGLSPQLTGANGRQIVEGARPGLFIDSVTDELLGREVLFVPGYKQRFFVEWKPNRGGLVDRHHPKDPMVVSAIAGASAFGKYVTPAGNDLVDTIYLFGALVGKAADPLPIDEYRPMVLAFSSTKMKPFKAYNTRFETFQLPSPEGRKRLTARYEHLLRLRSVSQTNAKGTFFNLVIEPAKGDVRSSILPPDDPRYRAGQKACELAASGRAKVADEEGAAQAEAETSAY